MTATAVAAYRDPLPDIVPPEKRAQWLECAHQARHDAVLGKALPRDYQDNPELIFAVYYGAAQLGMRPNVHLLKKFDTFDGITPRAQTLLGLLYDRGHHAWWGHFEPDPDRPGQERLVDLSDDTMAELTTVRRGETVRQVWHFTIDDARNAHLLDEWVERWIPNPNGEVWPDSKKPKMIAEKFVLGQDGVELPEWAAKEVRAGKTKRKDAWSNWRGQMLRNRVAALACRLTAPELLLGLDAWEQPPPMPAEVTGSSAEESGKSPPLGPAIAPTGATIPRAHREPPISDDDRAQLLADLEALKQRDGDAFARLQATWMELTGTPDENGKLVGVNLRTGLVARLHGWALRRMLDDVVPVAPTAEPTPTAVHDNAVEASGRDGDDPLSYDPADAG